MGFCVPHLVVFRGCSGLTTQDAARCGVLSPDPLYKMSLLQPIKHVLGLGFVLCYISSFEACWAMSLLSHQHCTVTFTCVTLSTSLIWTALRLQGKYICPQPCREKDCANHKPGTISLKRAQYQCLIPLKRTVNLLRVGRNFFCPLETFYIVLRSELAKLMTRWEQECGSYSFIMCDNSI